MPKLVNGRIDTATMIRLLFKHSGESWTAWCPRNEPWCALSAHVDSDGTLIVKYTDQVNVKKQEHGWVPNRSDWTIRRPPRAKPKPHLRPCFSLGTVTLGTSGAVKTSAGDERVMDELFALPDGEWVVEARRK